MNERAQGMVFRLIKDRGFGFIRGDADGISRFFEAKEVDPPIAFDMMAEGTRVTYCPVTMPPPAKGNGLRATQVRIIQMCKVIA